MSFEIIGKLVQKTPTHQVNEKFKKREFVLELNDDINGNTYTNYAKLQLVQNKCEVLDRYNEGDYLRVNFNIKGNRWERDGKVNFITNLDAWRIDAANQGDVANDDSSNVSGYQNSNNNSNQQGNNSYNKGNRENKSFSSSNDDEDNLPF